MGGAVASSDVQRKLTAILCADWAAGYSRLMGADEEATIETLTTNRKVFLTHIENNRGHVVNAKDDAICQRKKHNHANYIHSSIAPE